MPLLAAVVDFVVDIVLVVLAAAVLVDPSCFLAVHCRAVVALAAFGLPLLHFGQITVCLHS